MNKIKEPINLKYEVDYDYDVEYDCEEYGCNDDCCCRCGRISNIRVEKVDIKDIVSLFCKKILTIKLKNKSKEITSDSLFNMYCVDRLLRIKRCYNEDSYYGEACGGYYGDELEGIYLHDQSSLIDEILKIESLSISKKVERILEIEYGKVLDSVKNLKWKIQSVDPEDLIFGAKEWATKVSQEDISFYKEHDFPRGIFIKSGDKYRLIDGYHRCLAFVPSKDTPKIKIIVGTP